MRKAINNLMSCLTGQWRIIASGIFLMLVAVGTAVVWSSSCGGPAVTPTPVTLTSIAVTPAAPSIAAGATQQFTATGTRSDDSTVDLTATATWASSDAAVAAFETPATNGLATAMAAGTATISATDPDSGISSTDSGGDATVTVAALSGTVKALYPSNGANWNDYVKNDGADMFKATDTACDAATDGPGYNACLHGGQLRTVDVTGRSVCDDLTASDSLGVFNWVCDNTTNDVRMVSVGFAEGKGLSDLIDFDTASWRQLNVTVNRSGNAYLATDMAAWWTNPIILDNDGNDGTMMTAGEIYIVTANPNAQYIIGASQIALLIAPGVTLNGPGTPTDVISSTTRNFLWIEGAIDATSDSTAVYWGETRFSVLRNIHAENAQDAGIYLMNNSANNFASSIAVSNNNTGVRLWQSSNNTFTMIRFANSLNEGMAVRDSTENVFTNMISTNNGAVGVFIFENSTDNVFTGLTATNNENEGMVFHNNSTNNVVIDLTVANNGTIGLFIHDSSNNSAINVVAVNNGFEGVGLSGSNNNTLSNVAAANNENHGIFLNVSNNNYFTGFLQVGNNGFGDCGGGGAGTGINNDCTPEGASDHTLTTGITLANSFVAKATSDSVNAQGTNGTELYDDITDWINFENSYRGWGREGSDFPDVTNRRSCTTGNTCRIWDWSLNDTDTIIRDAIQTLPTGNDTLPHTWSDASGVIYLRRAVEIVGDYIGDDDGLCESNETCLFTPNSGSYQGHGNLVSAGAFTDGTLTGITLVEYETNGR